MELRIKNYVPKYQEGGPMPAATPEEAPVETGGQPVGGGDPVMELAQMAMQAMQGQDCEAAMAVCEGYLTLIQEMQGGGGEPAPEAAPEGEPVYRAGGKLVGRMN